MAKKYTKKTFAHKVRAGEKTILYELLPPPQHITQKDIKESLGLFAKLLTSYPVDGVNIPEVREETRSGIRIDKELIKLEPLTVAEHLQKYGIDQIIINRPIVYLPWEKQKKWLQHAYAKNIHNFIFVGGESSAISYPGISVTEAATHVTTIHKNDFADICLGGILIPNRKYEAEKLLHKTEAGIEFFTTQIIYEATAIKKVLQSYWDLCCKKGIPTKMIFLSFAPIATKKDIDLLLWLGVEFSKKTLQWLTTGWLGMAERSMQLCQNILQEILDFVKEKKIGVPLGINVEHINQHNFELSFLLLDRVSNIYL